MYSDENDDESVFRKANAKMGMEDALSFYPGNTAIPKEQEKDYDPFVDGKNFDGARMPENQQHYHFAFCYLCSASLVVYTELPNQSWRTKIYCSDPTNEDIRWMEGLHEQDFSKFPNQMLMLLPLNARELKPGEDTVMHYDVLVPTDFVFDETKRVDYDAAETQRKRNNAETRIPELMNDLTPQKMKLIIPGEGTVTNFDVLVPNDFVLDETKRVDNDTAVPHDTDETKIVDNDEAATQDTATKAITRKRKKARTVLTPESMNDLTPQIIDLFKDVHGTELELKKLDNTPRPLNRAKHVDVFFNDMHDKANLAKRLKSQRAEIESKLKEAGGAFTYRDLVEHQQKEERQEKRKRNYEQNAAIESLVQNLSNKRNNEQEENQLLKNFFGDECPKLNKAEKKEYKTWSAKMTKEEQNLWKDDQQQGKSMIALRFVIDDAKLNPYYEGKWKGKKGERDYTKKPLSKAWLLSHFNEQYLYVVRRYGQRKVKDPNKKDAWKFTPINRRWLSVPMGCNTNEMSVAEKYLCHSIPIRYPQGETSSCLFSAVASALSYMKHDKIAEHLINNKFECVNVDSNEQWTRLQGLLSQSNIINEVIYFKIYNRPQGKKRAPKHRLDVETLTLEHEDAMDVHAVCLIGDDGSQDHAVAIVNGMIFDSCTTHAMPLDRPPLDWCCNCKGGYGRTGRALRIKIKQCKFKKLHCVNPPKCAL